MKLITAIFRHITRHREGYIWPLVIIGAIVLAIHLANRLTGRAVVDDPGALVGYLYVGFGVALVVFLASQTQEHLFGFRSERKKDEPATLTDDIFDAVVSFGLLALIGFWIFK